MQCPNCQYMNSEEAKFCSECGVELVVKTYASKNFYLSSTRAKVFLIIGIFVAIFGITYIINSVKESMVTTAAQSSSKTVSSTKSSRVTYVPFKDPNVTMVSTPSHVYSNVEYMGFSGSPRLLQYNSGSEISISKEIFPKQGTIYRGTNSGSTISWAGKDIYTLDKKNNIWLKSSFYGPSLSTPTGSSIEILPRNIKSGEKWWDAESKSSSVFQIIGFANVTTKYSIFKNCLVIQKVSSKDGLENSFYYPGIGYIYSDFVVSLKQKVAMQGNDLSYIGPALKIQ